MSEEHASRPPHIGQRIKRILRLNFSTRIYIYSLLVGLISGLGAALFTYGLELGRFLLIEKLAGFPQSRPDGAVTFDFSFFEAPDYPGYLWLLLLLPAAGGLLGGYLAHRFAPEAEGPGGDAMIDAFHNGRGVIRPVVPLVKALTTIVTLASGGSGGKEGPLSQIGAGIGSWLGARLKLSAAQRRILLLAGTAGGLGAIFRAPLGGAITSVEVLYRQDFESDALIPCVISSIVAYSVYMGLFGFSHIFAIPELNFTDVRELFFYLFLGLLCAFVGRFYMKVFYTLRNRFFRPLRQPRYLVVGLGGLLVGLLGLIDPRTLGTGFGVLQQAIDGSLGLRALLLLALLKILSSSFTIGSGGSGGFFGPSLFIGGMLGGAAGLVGQQYFPDIVQQPAAYVIVGMASFFGAMANTPLAALIIVTEMTGSYHLLPPLMLVSAMALIFARDYSIYENQVESKFHSPAHLKDFTIDVLERLEVSEIFPQLRNTSAAVVSNKTPYFSLNSLSRKQGHLHFVVVDDDRRLRGMIRIDDLDLPEDEMLRYLILVEDMVIENVEPIRDTDDLHEALLKLLDSGFDKLPVIREDKEGEESASEFLGYMMYQDLLRVYHEEVERLERHE